MVLLAVTGGGLVSLSESDRSELLRLLLPLPSVFFATVLVGVAAGCCCFTNGSGILTSRDDGADITGVRATSIAVACGLLAIVLLGFWGRCLEAIGDLFSLHGGVGPFPSFLLVNFKLVDIIVVAVGCNLRTIFVGGAEAALSELLSSSLSHDNVSSSIHHMIHYHGNSINRDKTMYLTYKLTHISSVDQVRN